MKLFSLIIILISLNAFGKEITCENKINILLAPTYEEYGSRIGFPDLQKDISIGSQGNISKHSNDFGTAFNEKILLNTSTKEIKIRHRASENQSWSPPKIKKINLISEGELYYYYEIINPDLETHKEFILIFKQLNMYTHTNLRLGFEKIVRGECTIF